MSLCRMKETQLRCDLKRKAVVALAGFINMLHEYHFSHCLINKHILSAFVSDRKLRPLPKSEEFPRSNLLRDRQATRDKFAEAL